MFIKSVTLYEYMNKITINQHSKCPTEFLQYLLKDVYLLLFTVTVKLIFWLVLYNWFILKKLGLLWITNVQIYFCRRNNFYERRVHFYSFNNLFIQPQVSVCIPVLRLSRHRKKVLFYCHFPDQLLTQRKSFLKKLYRTPIDWLEESTTGMADMVNNGWELEAGCYRLFLSDCLFYFMQMKKNT